MKAWIAEIAYWFGWTTWYHVAYQFLTPKGLATGDMCISVRPWIRQGEGFKAVREYLKTQTTEHQCMSDPNIISITRIGH